MEVSIRQEPDFLTESLGLLQEVAMGNDIQRWKRNIEERGMDRSEWAASFFLVEKLKKKAMQEFQQEQELVQEYFTPIVLEDGPLYVTCTFTLAEISMMYVHRDYGMTVKEVRQRLEKLTEGLCCQRLQQLFEGDEPEKESRQLRCLEDVISMLDETELAAERKWKVLEVVSNPGRHFAKIENLLERGINLLREEERLWRPAFDKMVYNWRKGLEEKDIRTIFQECLKVEIRENPCGAIMLPEIMHYNRLAYLLTNSQNDMEPDIYRLGLLFDNMEHLKELGAPEQSKAFQKDYVLQILKCLSDKSKLQILTWLKEKRMYGSELASAMELTTATISHHMNTLIMLKLVSMEKEENRVYYRTNLAGIRKALDMVEEILLG